MRKYFGIFFLIGCSISAVVAFGADDAMMHNFVEGNAAYSVKQYAVAIDYYNKALQEGSSAALYFNLANAYAQDKSVGLAVLNYKRALLYAPRDADIRANLAFLTEASSIIPYPAMLGEGVVNYLTYGTWLYVAVWLFWLFVFLVGWRFYYLNRKRWLMCGIVIAFVGFCLAGYGAVVSSRLENRAIVISQTMVKLAPTSKSEDLSKLIPGQEVSVFAEYQDYVQVRLANGSEGWVSKNTVEQILLAR